MSFGEIVSIAGLLLAVVTSVVLSAKAYGKQEGKVESDGKMTDQRFATMQADFEQRFLGLNKAMEQSREALRENTSAVQGLSTNVEGLRKDIHTLELMHGERLTRAEERINSLLRSRRQGPGNFEDE